MTTVSVTLLGLFACLVLIHLRFRFRMRRTSLESARRTWHILASAVASWILFIGYGFISSISYQMFLGARDRPTKVVAIGINVVFVCAFICGLLLWHRTVLQRARKNTRPPDAITMI